MRCRYFNSANSTFRVTIMLRLALTTKSKKRYVMEGQTSQFTIIYASMRITYMMNTFKVKSAELKYRGLIDTPQTLGVKRSCLIACSR